MSAITGPGSSQTGPATARFVVNLQTIRKIGVVFLKTIASIVLGGLPILFVACLSAGSISLLGFLGVSMAHVTMMVVCLTPTITAGCTIYLIAPIIVMAAIPWSL